VAAVVLLLPVLLLPVLLLPMLLLPMLLLPVLLLPVLLPVLLLPVATGVGAAVGDPGPPHAPTTSMPARTTTICFIIHPGPRGKWSVRAPPCAS